jgi:hypothetical protein
VFVLHVTQKEHATEKNRSFEEETQKQTREARHRILLQARRRNHFHNSAEILETMSTFNDSEERKATSIASGGHDTRIDQAEARTESAWRTSGASFIGMAVGPGRKAWWTTARHFTFQFQNRTEAAMNRRPSPGEKKPEFKVAKELFPERKRLKNEIPIKHPAHRG